MTTRAQSEASRAKANAAVEQGVKLIEQIATGNLIIAIHHPQHFSNVSRVFILFNTSMQLWALESEYRTTQEHRKEKPKKPTAKAPGFPAVTKGRLD